ncbi:MAG TPA: energy transducer TonB [Terriglobia bacterium]|nr:energy transducer TonB [Terriglobia bacterium]
MGTAPFSPMSDRRDALSGTLLFSILLHAALFLLALAYTNFGFNFGRGWGRNWDTSGAIHATAVSSLPGVPLPTPMLATLNNVATENPGLYKTEPQPPPPPEPQAEEIPKFKEELKPEKMVRVNKRIPKQETAPPINAVPFGTGGQPVMTTGQFSNAAGHGDLEAEGDFGARYGWYVSAVRTRISTNWLLSTISPSILTAPRVYLTFDILRDGSVENVQITQSSGVPEVDRSALRAVLASNPLGALPSDFSGNKVSVNFFFDFHRQ